MLVSAHDLHHVVISSLQNVSAEVEQKLSLISLLRADLFFFPPPTVSSYLFACGGSMWLLAGTQLCGIFKGEPSATGSVCGTATVYVENFPFL